MLVVENINKWYGAIHVLKDVSLQVNDSEIVAVTGPSGAGKTTLLQIMGTLERPDSGIVSFDNKAVSGMKDKEISRFRNKNIGFVFQFHQLLPEFTLLENVMLPAMISRQERRNAKDRARKLLEEVGLGERLDHKPSQLSGGECQRGAVARALINSPSIVFADEPTGNLDSFNSLELSDLFFKMRANHGTTFVIVTHDKELASRCDRILEISDGVIKTDCNEQSEDNLCAVEPDSAHVGMPE